MQQKCYTRCALPNWTQRASEVNCYIQVLDTQKCI